jgi:hypothetical protein
MPQKLFDPQLRDGTDHHYLLDLLGALEDVEGVQNLFADSRSLLSVRSRSLSPAQSGRFRVVLLPE